MTRTRTMEIVLEMTWHKRVNSPRRDRLELSEEVLKLVGVNLTGTDLNLILPDY
jgi:hypothetical protein